jgi:sugar lactone lactonase YvrE
MEPRLLLDGLAFPEGPRWHDGRLWFSDVHVGDVIAVDLHGAAEVIVHVPSLPSGLGWLPDGTLLIVSVENRQVLRLDGKETGVHGDLAHLATFGCNDMVVDGHGHAYVGSCDNAGIPRPAPGELLLVHPDGRTAVVDPSLRFPNGSVITPDGRTLIVAETFGDCLTAFTVADDGMLEGRREWAPLGGGVPDGIALDAEGCVWYADPVANACMRVREGGAVAGRIPTDQPCFACMLGGNAGTTLFLLTSASPSPAQTVIQRPGRIEMVEVDVPGVGWP